MAEDPVTVKGAGLRTSLHVVTAVLLIVIGILLNQGVKTQARMEDAIKETNDRLETVNQSVSEIHADIRAVQVHQNDIDRRLDRIERMVR